MGYIGVSDLKHSKRLFSRLAAEQQLVLTRDGRPSALIVAVPAEGVEHAMKAVRRALFSSAVANARARATRAPASAATLAREIAAARAGK